MRRRIALIRYAPDYFMPFARALDGASFDVYWVNALHSESCALREAGVAADRWLDTTAAFHPAAMSLDECRYRLGRLEAAAPGPRIHDLIMMDRHLRRRPTEFAIRYLAHLERVITDFLQRNQIELATSGRDTALQILTMLICRREGIPWVVPTRARIPQELYGFCQSHDTEELVQMRGVGPQDREWAARCLEQFEGNALQPALKKSARSFLDVLRLLPVHARTFRYEVGKSRLDRGNDYARYTITDLAAMYARRRVNMLAHKLANPCQPLGESRFALFALHTQPESSIDVVGSFHSDQVALIRLIARSLPATHELYVKVHPTDVDGQPRSFYNALKSIPGVRLIGHEHDSRGLLRRADLLFALTGTIAYEAGLMGRPVITFARNYFNALPTVRRCDTPTDLPRLIEEVMGIAAPADTRAAAIEFLARLRTCCFEGEVNRTYGVSANALSDADLSGLQRAYSTLADRLLRR